MTPLPFILAPLALLWPAVAGDDAMIAAADDLDQRTPSTFRPITDGHAVDRAMTPWAPQTAHQVRIERRVVIRIAPRRRPARATTQNTRNVVYRRVEMGDCVLLDQIGAVRPSGENRLLLFGRGGEVVSAELQRSCSARSFYSGFYVEKSSDGRLCVARERLRSRNGASCQITAMSRLQRVSD